MKRFFAVVALAAILWSCSKEDSANISVLSFEGIDAVYLAGPTSYGENLYDSYQGDKVTTYYDAATQLSFGLYKSNFWDGGMVASTWNDTQTAGYLNQCSVFYKDPVTGKGGHNGSATFGVVGTRATLTFDLQREAVMESLYVCNATYSALSMQNGDDFAQKHSYDNKAWFKVVFTGINNAEEETGRVEVYLSDFRQPSSPGLMAQWTKVNLSTLGRVQQVNISFEGSDMGAWGLNTPAYVCIDDILVRR